MFNVLLFVFDRFSIVCVIGVLSVLCGFLDFLWDF